VKVDITLEMSDQRLEFSSSCLCDVPEVEPSLVVCGAFCLVEFTRQRVTKVPMIFALVRSISV
jgi:hypothetical protein